MTYPLAMNGNSTGQIWTRQVEVRISADARVYPSGGLLGTVRRFAPSSAAALGLLFTLHCSRVTVAHSVRRTSRLPNNTVSDARGYEETGEASWYGGNGDGFAGKPTASGERFDPQELTCAHRTLPLGTYLEVENLDNGKRIIVKVNDRGPFARGRILDLSKRAALDLGFLADGFTQVAIRTVDISGAPKALDPSLDQLNPYTIQVAALAEQANIERLKRELEQASFGPVSLVDGVARDGRLVKRVRTGSYARLMDAEQAADSVAKFFKDRGVEPFITRQR